jgi:hypothetical protein
MLRGVCGILALPEQQLVLHMPLVSGGRAVWHMLRAAARECGTLCPP